MFRNKIFCFYTALLFLLQSCSGVSNAKFSEELPPIWPDYTFVTVPVNIAPLNFGIEDYIHYDKMSVIVKNEGGETVLTSSGDHASFGLRRWHRLLSNVAGGKLTFHVSVKTAGEWVVYSPFEVYVSRDSIDYGLTYRMIPPGYQSFGHMGIYERTLSSYKEKTLVDTRMIDSGCINCHTQNRTDPSKFSIHIRGKHPATYMYLDGKEECLNTVTDSTKGFFVYPYWHPSGKYIAYSINATRQSFYSSAEKVLEVYDENSDVIVYCPETHEVLRPVLTNRPDKFETKPAFSADGRTLYFSVSDGGILPRDIKRMKYSLCSLSFDPDTKEFGDKVDTLLSASQYNKTFISPRPSYDGKYLLVTVADFGTFLIHHNESDLWLYNVSTGEFRNAGGINSDDSESFHNWSSNSKWAVVSSRRDDGLYTRLYLAHFNEEKAMFDKAFLLPQKDPCVYYTSLIYSYNAPDFTSGPVPLDANKLRKQVISPVRQSVRAREWSPREKELYDPSSMDAVSGASLAAE